MEKQIIELRNEAERRNKQLQVLMEKKTKQGIEHQEEECQKLEHQEMERQEMERQEMERQEMERQEMERQEMERQEMERQEMEHQEMERQEMENQEMERQEMEHQEMERYELERHQWENNWQEWNDDKNVEDCASEWEDWIKITLDKCCCGVLPQHIFKGCNFVVTSTSSFILYEIPFRSKIS